MSATTSSPLLQPSFRSRSSTNANTRADSAGLTSFNPFAEEDEHDQSSFNFTSLFEKVRNAVSSASRESGPLKEPTPVSDSQEIQDNRPQPNNNHHSQSQSSLTTNPSAAAQKHAKSAIRPSLPQPAAAPPLVSLTAAQPEALTYIDSSFDRSPSRISHNGAFYVDSPDGYGTMGTVIPGFPMPRDDDARSIKTSTSLHRSNSVSKVMRRIRGEGLSRDYWMDDENCKECYDCKSVFTTWRRKHHCRICGQIFCSRCASSIIKGYRFGHEGMIRVCNLCLSKLSKADSDDEDDRMSTTSSFPGHQYSFSLPSFLGGGHPSSPFSSSLLGKREEGEPQPGRDLYSIAEARRMNSIDDGFGYYSSSRPITPSWEGTVSTEPAPFRRTLSSEEDSKDAPIDDDPFAPEPSPVLTTTNSNNGANNIEFPLTVPINNGNVNGDNLNTIVFPVGSPEKHSGAVDDSSYPGRIRSRFNSFDVPTPFIRSRVQSRLEIERAPMAGEIGWRTRRESTAYAQELNLMSMLHLKMLLRQLLTNEEIPDIKTWESVLLRLSLRIARDLTFTTSSSTPSTSRHQEGQEMDLRRYVKIKKIPGGAPTDSEFVDGVVITKNVAHKRMSRLQSNPRIMLVTFPLEFSRVEGQYLHFGQIVRQEKEYLGNLASRIAALRPHVVLVEKSVSRLALDALAAHNIAVARAVKPEAISFISRMTQADVFSSISNLSLSPRLGHCAKYTLQTFDHPLIPGRRKTYMRFEGCNYKDLGCTIILRGADESRLRKVKKVMRFLIFVVRNLKLETCVWKDELISLPSFFGDETGSVNPRLSTTSNLSVNTLLAAAPSISTPQLRTPVVDPHSSSTFAPFSPISPKLGIIEDDEDLPNEDLKQLRLSRRINEVLEPYANTFISVSATLRFQPPYPLKRMKEFDDELLNAKRDWEDEVVQREEKLHGKEVTITQSNATTPGPLMHPTEVPSIDVTLNDDEQQRGDINAQIEALALTMPNSPGSLVASPLSTAPAEGTSYFSHTPASAGPVGLHSSILSSTATTPMGEQPPEQLKTAADIAAESHYTFLKWKHREQQRIWEWYLRKNKDDFVVEKYQCISFLEYTVPINEFGRHRACFAPGLRYITFYGENDCTLGGFIEKEVKDTVTQFLDPKAICTGKGCDQPLARHYKVYVHNGIRLFVAVEQWDGQILRNGGYYPTSPESIMTWSTCRVCGSATPFIPVSLEMQRYSFGKFIELLFYPTDVKLVQGAGCQHNIYEHHTRYFSLKGLTVRFQTDPVALYEVVYPPFRIRVRPEMQLELKNKDFERLHYRNSVWYTALIDDLKLISIDAATGDEETDAKLLADINALIERAEKERDSISRMINQVYRESTPTDTLALNQIHAVRQDKIVAWQQDFDRLPKPKAPNVAPDRGSKRASTFGSVRAMWPRRYDLSGTWDLPHLPSSSVSEAEEGPFGNIRRVTGDSFASSASEASDAEMSQPSGRKFSSPSSLEQSTVLEDVNSEQAKLQETLSEETPKPDIPPITDSPQDATIKDSGVGAAREKRSGSDSDSTIGAKEGASSPKIPSEEPLKARSPESQEAVARISRLPRRPSHNPSVAELVKRYQDYLPPQGVHDLARTALAPSSLVSESEQEYPSQPVIRHARQKSRHRAPAKKAPTSDFESSYAANIAPRYLTHARRHGIQTPKTSRIPGPIPPALVESQQSSRRPSPEKKSTRKQSNIRFQSRPASPPSDAAKAEPSKPGRSRLGKSKEKAPPRLPPSTKSTFRRPPSNSAGGKVSTMTRHFEKIDRNARRAESRYAVIRGGRRARPVASSKAKVQVLDSVKDAIDDDESESSSSSSEADDEGDDDAEGPVAAPNAPTSPRILPAETSQPIPPLTAPPERTFITPSSEGQDSQALALPHRDTPPGPISLPPSPLIAGAKPPASALPTPSDLDLGGGPERHSILKAISGLWLQPAPTLRQTADIDDPLDDPEHIFRDSSMVVRTDEPTSIIALALNSPQYREMLAKSRAEKRTARATENSGEAFMPDDRSISESTSTWGVVDVDAADSADPTEDLRVPSSKLPWAITFESGGLTISCTVLYPEQFDALRRTYDCEKSMIESLARCVKWDASGGKSGSAFLKTRDDRFIAKELSRPELQTMETFAPAYFDYMLSAVCSDRPTLLAKVFGCYKITFRKTGKDNGSSKSKSTQMNLLVMENLFYDRRFSKIYDLKGSTRNRHVQSTGRANEVLLDENLVETAHENPFYLREHSKRILRGALYNDSKFLADINVMDYSLVCGVDSQNDELVVGIVDYIRTYTWDKKLESWVKESAFLGGAGRGEPTIVTPKQYRQRFISAMERYFPLIPDRWMKLKDVPEEDSKSLTELWPDW